MPRRPTPGRAVCCVWLAFMPLPLSLMMTCNKEQPCPISTQAREAEACR